MNFETFKSSLNRPEPPSGISPYLKALWYAGHKNWDKAHEVAQDINDSKGSWIHAYLHRREGDHGNARYWYERAGKNFPEMTLDSEWESLVHYFL